MTQDTAPKYVPMTFRPDGNGWTPAEPGLSCSSLVFACVVARRRAAAEKGSPARIVVVRPGSTREFTLRPVRK